MQRATHYIKGQRVSFIPFSRREKKRGTKRNLRSSGTFVVLCFAGYLASCHSYLSNLFSYASPPRSKPPH
jgi:hypothetical protein